MTGAASVRSHIIKKKIRIHANYRVHAGRLSKIIYRTLTIIGSYCMGTLGKCLGLNVGVSSARLTPSPYSTQLVPFACFLVFLQTPATLVTFMAYSALNPSLCNMKRLIALLLTRPPPFLYSMQHHRKIPLPSILSDCRNNSPQAGAVTSWLVCSTPNRAVRFWALAEKIVLYS